MLVLALFVIYSTFTTHHSDGSSPCQRRTKFHAVSYACSALTCGFCPDKSRRFQNPLIYLYRKPPASNGGVEQFIWYAINTSYKTCDFQAGNTNNFMKISFKKKKHKNSVAGNRTRVSWVKARYPNRWTTTDWCEVGSEIINFMWLLTLFP